MKFIITIGNDAEGWSGYDADAPDMDQALNDSGALGELTDRDEGEVTIKIRAGD